MASKEEQLEELSDEQLKQLADDADVDVPPAPSRAELIEALASSRKVTKSDVKQLRQSTDGGDGAGSVQEIPGDPALVAPEETAAANFEGTTSDASTRVEGTSASEVGSDPHQIDKATDGPNYAFPPAGDVEVATVDPGSGEGESWPGLNADDWVILDGSHDAVPDRLDGHRAVVLNAPIAPVPLAELNGQELLVKTRDEANATLSIPFEAVKSVIKGGKDLSNRG